MTVMIQRDRPRAVWWEIISHLDSTRESLRTQGRTDELQASVNAAYKLQVMLDNARWDGKLTMSPDSIAVLDDAFAALCGVVEEPSNDTDAVTQADAIIRENQRGRLRRA